MVLIKRIQFIKQTSLTNIHGMYTQLTHTHPHLYVVHFPFISLSVRILFFCVPRQRWSFVYFCFIAYLLCDFPIHNMMMAQKQNKKSP